MAHSFLFTHFHFSLKSSISYSGIGFPQFGQNLSFGGTPRPQLGQNLVFGRYGDGVGGGAGPEGSFLAIKYIINPIMPAIRVTMSHRTPFIPRR